MTHHFTESQLMWNLDEQSGSFVNTVGFKAEYIRPSQYADYGIPASLDTDGFTIFKIISFRNEGSGIPSDVLAGDFLCCKNETAGDWGFYFRVMKLDIDTATFTDTQYYSMAGYYNEFTDEDILNSVQNIDANVNSLGYKLDSLIALVQGIRGAVVDVKNQPTDACIIRIYVGDQTNKRNAAAREITRLLGEGYRPYQTFGISEDLARVLFVKYPEPNDANPVEP